MDDIRVWQAVAERAAREAGALMLRRLQEPLELQSKGFRDVVTAVDYEAQALITGLIREAFPSHGFLAEEEDSSLPEHGDVKWIIDPIDGTGNYSRGIPSFCTSIAAAVDEKVVLGVIYDPNLKELFSAVRGEGGSLNGEAICCSSTDSLDNAVVCLDWSREKSDRRLVFDALVEFGLDVRTIRATGSATLALAWVAAGRFDGYVNLTISPWDWAAAALLIEESGGRFAQLDGAPPSFTDTCSVIAATDQLFAPLQQRISRYKPPT